LINPLLIVILIQGWTESGVLKESLLKKVLESIPGVMVIVPDYLEPTARGKFAKFRTHKSVQDYAGYVWAYYRQTKADFPRVPVLVVGHSLGGIIARYLHEEGFFPAKDMILVGTPNKGITYRTLGGSFGVVVLPILKVVASKRFCNVPVFYELLEGSIFLKELNAYGIPEDAYYISGSQDNIVPLWSSDPHNIGEFAECGHHLFPNEGVLAEKSAIPLVERIVKERLAEIKAAS